MARQAGAAVSLDLSAWTLIDDAFRARALGLQPQVVFATEAERDAFGDLEASWVVKRGADGVIVDGEEYAVAPGELVDPTGAGDAFAAGYLVGNQWAGRRSPIDAQQAMLRASIAAAVAVALAALAFCALGEWFRRNG